MESYQSWKWKNWPSIDGVHYYAKILTFGSIRLRRSWGVFHPLPPSCPSSSFIHGCFESFFSLAPCPCLLSCSLSRLCRRSSSCCCWILPSGRRERRRVIVAVACICIIWWMIIVVSWPHLSISILPLALGARNKSKWAPASVISTGHCCLYRNERIISSSLMWMHYNKLLQLMSCVLCAASWDVSSKQK